MLTWNQGFGMGRPRIRRRLRTYATAILLALAVLVVAGWSTLPFFVERRLLEELRATGIAVANLNVAAVGLHENGLKTFVLARVEMSLPVRSSRRMILDTSYKRSLSASSFAICELPPDATPAVSRSTVWTSRVRNGGGGILDEALFRAVPPVVIESARIELVTPIGRVAIPFRGVN